MSGEKTCGFLSILIQSNKQGAAPYLKRSSALLLYESDDSDRRKTNTGLSVFPGNGQAPDQPADKREEHAVNRKLNDVLKSANRKRGQTGWAVEHGQEYGIEEDIDKYDDHQTRCDDLPGRLFCFVEKQPVDQAAEQSSEGKTGEIRTCRLEQETENIAECALNRGGYRTKKDGRRRKGKMREGDLEAVGDFDHAVRGKYHLNSQKEPDSSDGGRTPKGTERIGKLGTDQRKDGKHKKPPPQIKPD